MKFCAVVFDWDGTLFDSMSYKRENFIKLFLGFSIDREALYNYHLHASGIPRKDLFNQCLQKFKLKSFFDEEYLLLSKQYTDLNIMASKDAKCFSDVEPILNKIKYMGIKMFISSSSAHDELIKVVSASGIASYFTEVLGSQEQLKKGPQHIDYICDKYHLRTNEIIFIGDDEKDLELGKESNVFSLRIVRGQSVNTKSCITDLEQLTVHLF